MHITDQRLSLRVRPYINHLTRRVINTYRNPNPQLCDYAQAWANHLAHTNKFHYRNDRDVGQNLYQRPVSALQPDVTGI